MNTSVRQTGARNLRRRAIPEISPITSAIRKALVASALMAMTLPAAALAAGECGNATMQVRCETTFAGSARLAESLDDPTLVIDGMAPSAVHAGIQTLVPSAYASGIVVVDPYSAVLENGDAIMVGAYADGEAQAYGAIASSDELSYLTNTDAGSIDVVAGSDYGMAIAVGAYAYAGDFASLSNYGDISATAASDTGIAQAYAAAVISPFGIGVLINGGSLDAQATAGDGGQAHANGAYVVANVASVFNDGSTGAIATAGDGGLADARGARAYGSYVAVSNYGTLTATANADGGVAIARGADSLGMLGASVYNAGDIQASATAEGGTASAFGSYSVGVSALAYTTNNGTISAQASGDSARAYGTLNASAYYGDAITTNTGSISALAEGGVAAYGEAEAIAFGAYNFALLYNSVVDNSGTISATATAMADISGSYGFLQVKAIAAEAISVYGYGDTVIANSGDIDAVAMTSQGYASAWGAVVQTTGLYGGTAMIDNQGGISAHAYADIGIAYAIGAYAIDQVGDASVVNHGDISASARAERGIPGVTTNYAYATGVKESSFYGTVDIANYGSISAMASAEGAITGARGIQAGGAYVSITNAAGASIVATGEVDLFGGGFATGIEAMGSYGIDIVNDGDIDVYGHAHAYGTHYGAARALGIYASANLQGNVSVTNNGDIAATALAEDSLSFFQGGAGATGINAYAKYDATIVNNGDITASAQSEFGITGAYGVVGHGKYSTSVVNAAGAGILAEASVGTLVGDSYGGRAVSFGTHVFGNGMEHGLVYNAGSIVSHATATAESASQNPTIASAWGASVGAYSNVLSGTIINLGDVEAAASADFGYATAYGSYVLAGAATATSNQGTIFASADAIHGNAWSVGSFGRAVEQYQYVPCEVVEGPYGPYNLCDYGNAYWVVTGGDASLDNGGGIASRARAEGGVGASYGAVMLGGFSASIANSGQISAIAEADDALAVGALANAFYGEASIANSGDIGAIARGDIAVARGVHVLGLHGTQVDNSGAIMAGAYGADATATAVAMESSGSNVLHNSGIIAAFGDGERIAVESSAGSTAQLYNTGTLIGAIRTGDGDDLLDNAAGASWLALGSSDFGAGDDAIVNHGSIVLQDATIALGAYASGNAFDNSGVLAVSGVGGIDMGGAFAFVNNGTLSFVDGAADDSLTLAATLAGSGTLNFDADLASQSGDRLYLDGDMAASAVQTINVNVVGGPVQAHERIDLIATNGTLAGEFELGSLYNPGTDFLSQAFALSRSAQAVWLDADVVGLNDTGTLAANVASGAADMLNAQVGTFKQRMGVNPYGDDGKVLSAFFRTYTSEGDVEPAHVAANFGQGGNFAYDQSIWGREVGVNANLHGNFHAGITLGTADGRQRLTGNGVGQNRMDGMTWGWYATWFAPQGFYVDVSGRQMAVDVLSTSAAGQLQTRAHTGALNLEAGYQWTLGGLSVVPQLQYTRTEVEDVRAIQGERVDFQGHGGTSSRGRVGVEISKTFQSGDVRWTPYGSINAIREFDGEMTYAVADNFFGSIGSEGTSAMAELGLGVQKKGWGFTIGANWTDGGAFKSTLGGQAIVRIAW